MTSQDRQNGDDTHDDTPSNHLKKNTSGKKRNATEISFVEEMTKVIVEHTDCNSNMKDKSGDAPLHIASHNGRWNIVQYLVKKGSCDVNTR